MTIFVFTGPTLSAEDVAKELDARCLPPVSQGDVYRVGLERPFAIGIIDGYFERVPAVWHKEILWSMAQGIHVFGSASMGALRAAELASYGMVGVGAIFEAFRQGVLEDDDEVAIAHGPAETGYQALSDAMVNIRATLGEALAQRVITTPVHDALVGLAKETFYAFRSYPELFARAIDRGLPRAEIDALRAFLPSSRVDQKRRDAIAMLRAIADQARAEPGPKQVRYHFEHTDLWDQVGRRAGRLKLATQTESIEPLLDELRLAGEVALSVATTAALARALAREEAERQGVTLTRELLEGAATSFLAERDLRTAEDLDAWITKHDLNAVTFDRFLRGEVLLRWVETMFEPDIARHLPDHLRARGTYGALRTRALDKQQRLANRGLESPSLQDLGMREDELVRWYFEERRREPRPADLDRYVAGVGCPDRDTWLRIVLRERYYCQLIEAEGGEAGGGRATSPTAPAGQTP